MATLTVGMQAPNFSLPTQTGALVVLNDLVKAQAVVVIFYPKDQTPACTKQLCAVRDDAAAYAQAGLRVFGINGDNASSHERFITKHRLSTPLLVDRDLVVARAYGALISIGPLKIINRTVVGIDRSGKIVFYQRGTPSTETIIASFRTA